MQRTNPLNDLLLAELADLLDGENQLAEFLPKMAQASQSLTLKLILEAHLEITKGHAGRLHDIFSNTEQNPHGATCKAMKELIKESQGVVNQTGKGQACDAIIINAVKSMEYYEIDSYQKACDHAAELNHTGMVESLHKTLDEERSMYLHLNELAQGMINAQAIDPKGHSGGFYIKQERFARGGTKKKTKSVEVSRFINEGNPNTHEH